MIDYILTAAVGISAGVTALTSAVPAAAAVHAGAVSADSGDPGDGEYARREGHGRGVYSADVSVYRDAADRDRGGWRPDVSGAGAHPMPVATMPPPMPATVQYLGWWLLLKAFASGCAAMTGVEAVSNGVMAFGEPRAKKAQRTLTVIIAILMVLLFGTAYLAKSYQIMAMDPELAATRAC